MVKSLKNHEVPLHIGAGSFGRAKQEGEHLNRKDELPLINRDQDKRRKERIKSRIVILALVAVIVYLVLKQI